MALSEGTLENLIVSELEAVGFTTVGDYAYARKLAKAISKAVISHIKTAAEVNVNGGSSAGTYKVS